VFIASAMPSTRRAGRTAAGGELFQIVFLVGLFVLFYFIAIRPQRKRQKEHAAMVAALSKGDEVVTSSGILGKITSLDDNYVVLNVHGQGRPQVPARACARGTAQGHAEEHRLS
jgi:preprotein translocase subunit YajC